MKIVTDFLFLGSKVIADGKCSHEIKRHLLLGRKAMTNLDSVLKSRDIKKQVKNLPAMQETWVWSLGQEDPLEKEMAIHSSILA